MTNHETVTRIPATSLTTNIEEAVREGQLGSIVSLRLMFRASDSENSNQNNRTRAECEELAKWLCWSSQLFHCQSGRLYASRDETRGELSTLLSLDTGSTISLTLICANGKSSDISQGSPNTMQLLLLGQHGIARLQGGEEIDPRLDQFTKGSEKWISAIEESLNAGQATVVS